ncbi:MAG: ATP-binding protein [Chitinispirillaceae bacterium]|nr:ATP-binding protein [Chitinispirillaceae bacterium]
MLKSETPGKPLRPRARLIRTLGEELISGEDVAILELVKNAYDADATHVLIRFTGPFEQGKGSIDVIDNGHGMTLDTLQNVWMEPATPSKRGKLRRTDKFKRRFLGEKGIGRFASSRLAYDLEVITRKENAAKEVYGIFDWRQFEDEEKYLDEILILWEERTPVEVKPGGTIDLLWKNEGEMPVASERQKGTILRMTGFKQRWEGQHFEDLRRKLARLVSPKRTQKKGNDKDPGFEVELKLPSEFSRYSSKIEPPPILKHPHYVIKGEVDTDGSFNLSYKVLAEGIDKPFKGHFFRVMDAKGRFDLRHYEAKDSKKGDEPTVKRPVVCGPLEMELRIWDRDELGNVVQKTHSTIQDVRRDLDSVAGINIYRDGFRVLPYGEPQDDWLRLDLRRVQKPTMRLSNNQIYGVIQISAEANPNLRDQSNREGLDENQALQDLRDIMKIVLNQLEIMRHSIRPRESNKNKKPVGGLFSGFDFKPLADYVAKHLPQDMQARELVDKTEQIFGGQLKEIQTVLARYQRLATLGQLIDHVLHESRQPIASINSESALGLEDVQNAGVLKGDFIKKAASRFTVIRKQGDVLATAFRRMEPFGGRRRGRPTQLYLEEIIRDAFTVFDEDTTRLNIKTKISRTQTLVRVDPAEIQEVIINLLQNSLYWLEQVNESKREIEVCVERKTPDHVEILFSDSGPGISPENRELIFEPYFSTKPEGVGLGLAIVGEIVSDYYEGSLELLKSGPLRGASFLITLRKRV